MPSSPPTPSLDDQLAAFARRRFLAIPLAIVLVYGVTIFVLESRWRALGRASA